MPKSKQFVESSDDSSDSEPKTKKNVSKRSKRDESSEEEVKEKPKKAKKEAKKEKEPSESVWELGNNRQVTVREFKGKLFVDIREMYFDKDGDIKPGKKGICMNMAQWRKFMDVVTDVDEAVKAKC